MKALLTALLTATVLMGGCARYKVVIHPDGSGELSIWSGREFPEGLETNYKDFKFRAGSVRGSDNIDAIRDIVELGVTGRNTDKEE